MSWAQDWRGTTQKCRCLKYRCSITMGFCVASELLEMAWKRTGTSSLDNASSPLSNEKKLEALLKETAILCVPASLLLILGLVSNLLTIATSYRPTPITSQHKVKHLRSLRQRSSAYAELPGYKPHNFNISTIRSRTEFNISMNEPK